MFQTIWKYAVVTTALLLSSVTHSFSEDEITLKLQSNQLELVDKVMLGNAIKLLADDLGQTLDIKNWRNKYESNAALGEHPSDDRIYFYFAGCAITTAAASYVESKTIRRTIWGSVAVLQATVVYLNSKGGLGSELADNRRRPIVVSMVFPF